jgi:predicted alpha-1,6-mannanase (GH76 family)
MRAALLCLAACASGHAARTPDGAVPAVDAAPAADAPPDAAPMVDWAGRADSALESMLLHYWTGSYFNGAQYWTFAQAYDAALDGLERSGRFAGWPETLYRAQDAKGWSSNFYDDENWMVLALIRTYDLSHDTTYLDRAKSIYADIESAWDTSCCGTHPGGIWWDHAHSSKATAANAGAVIAGVRLAARTGDQSYQAFAQQVYTYWRANMVDPTTHAVTDDIHSDGTLVHYTFTYNEGLMIGAAVELGMLGDAHDIAGYMLSAETKNGILSDGTNDSCGGDCQQFKGIGFRYLTELQQADPRPEVGALLDASAQAIWNDARSQDMVFSTDWAGPPVSSPSIDAESSAVMALGIHARALGEQPSPQPRYEAEEGVLHSLGLEASHVGFGGWGYLAGWHNDGQWVDFHVHNTASTSSLVLHYGAGAGNASRLIYIDGATAVANQAFAGTGAWDAWDTVTLPITLAAGDHTISVIYNSSQGSTNYINLDWLALM